MKPISRGAERVPPLNIYLEDVLRNYSFVAYDDGAENMVLIAFNDDSPMVGIVTPKWHETSVTRDINRLITATDVYGCDLIDKKACAAFAQRHDAIGSADQYGNVEVWNEEYEWYFKKD